MSVFRKLSRLTVLCYYLLSLATCFRHIGHLPLCTTWYHYVPLCTHMSYMYLLFTCVLHIPHVPQCPFWHGSHHPVTRCPLHSLMSRVALLRAARCRYGMVCHQVPVPVRLPSVSG